MFSLTSLLLRLIEVRRAKGRGRRGFVASVDCGSEYLGRWGAGLRRVCPQVGSRSGSCSWQDFGHEEEGDSDEVQVLEVVAAMPISYAFPASTFPANPAGQVHDAEPIASRPPVTSGKRGAPADASEAAPKKRTKKSAPNPPRRKIMPGVAG